MSTFFSLFFLLLVLSVLECERKKKKKLFLEVELLEFTYGLNIFGIFFLYIEH